MFGRFKTLLWSTTSCWLLVHLHSAWWYFVDLYSKGLQQLFLRHAQFFPHSIICISLCKSIFFANILQFGTDQLRDMPTLKSTFSCWPFIGVTLFSELLALSTNIPGHEVVISPNTK